MKRYEIGLNEDEIEELFLFSLYDEIVVHHLKKGEESFLDKLTALEFIKKILVPDIIRKHTAIEDVRANNMVKENLTKHKRKEGSFKRLVKDSKTRNNDQNRDHTAFHNKCVVSSLILRLAFSKMRI